MMHGQRNIKPIRMFKGYLVSGLCPSSSAPNEANILEDGSVSVLRLKVGEILICYFSHD